METFLTNAVPTSKGKIFLNTVFWGFVLWLFGYILGFVFFAIAPKELIGWYILPFGVAFTLFVLIKRVSRSEFGCYFGLGLIWTIMAIVLDYFLLVKMLNTTNYYKIDVYIYYILTFILPLLVGWYKFKKEKSIN